MRKIKVNPKQMVAYNSTAQETFFVGGIGMGKTFFLGMTSYRALTKPGAVILIAAPTDKVMRNSTLKQIQEAWAKIGFNEHEHYVINIKPPNSWGVKVWSSVSNSKILTTRWGSYAVLDGLDNFETQRGIEFDEINIDEFWGIKEDGRNVLLGRLRGRLYKSLGLQHRIWYATTPPKNPAILKNIAESKNQNILFVYGSTHDNVANLPSNYISNLKAAYDDFTYRREVLGELIVNTTKAFFYSFDRTKHVRPVQLEKAFTVYLSFDFNVDPITCIACQHDNAGTPFGWIKVLREFRLSNSDIYKLCAEINKAYPTARFEVTGDASGKNRSAMVMDNVNFYQIICNELGIVPSQLKIPGANPSIANNRVLCNSLFARHPDISIDPSCRHLIEDLEHVEVTDSGDIDKSKHKHLTHLLDCLRYYFNTFHGLFTKVSR